MSFVPGHTYRTVYGYPWRHALSAEFWWRVEHLPWRYDGQLFAPLTRHAYGRRKAAERRGAGV
jgi:hypothetical protein